MCSQDPFPPCSQPSPCLPLLSSAGLTSPPGRLRRGPAGQGLHGGPGSLGRDQGQASGRSEAPWDQASWFNPWVPARRIPWHRIQRWHLQLLNHRFTWPALGTRLCACAHAYVGWGASDRNTDPGPYPLGAQRPSPKYNHLSPGTLELPECQQGWRVRLGPSAPFSNPHLLPFVLPSPIAQALFLPGVMPGGCRLRSRGVPLAPPSQASALSAGSQLTVVSGNTSSWKNSFCSDGGRGCSEALSRGPEHTGLHWAGGHGETQDPNLRFLRGSECQQSKARRCPTEQWVGQSGDKTSQAPKPLTGAGEGWALPCCIPNSP